MPTDTPPGKDFEPPKYLASLIAAINDGAKAGMLLFMLVGLYLLATAFSASDEDILLGRTVTISQIGASLPVSFSFALAPFAGATEPQKSQRKSHLGEREIAMCSLALWRNFIGSYCVQCWRHR